MSELMTMGLQLMGYGLIGVFSTLLLFILVIKILVRVFPHRESDEDRAS